MHVPPPAPLLQEGKSNFNFPVLHLLNEEDSSEFSRSPFQLALYIFRITHESSSSNILTVAVFPPPPLLSVFVALVESFQKGLYIICVDVQFKELSTNLLQPVKT